MKPDIHFIRIFLQKLGFELKSGTNNEYVKRYSNHNNYAIIVDTKEEKIHYSIEGSAPQSIKVCDHTTDNFEKMENFVTLECVDRLLCLDYPPSSIVLEQKYPLGRDNKGKLDINVLDKEGKSYIMIECKTWGEEFDNEEKKMRENGGQIFSYYIQDKDTSFLCLYTSQLNGEKFEYKSKIVKVKEDWRILPNLRSVFNSWDKTLYDNGIFDEAVPYHVQTDLLKRSQLIKLTEDSSRAIFNEFKEILRQNVVSDKPNAFNKILNLFICKIIDEDKSEDELLDFQWMPNDTYESMQKRLNDLYKKGMHKFLNIDVTDYTDEEIDKQLLSIDDENTIANLRTIITRLRLQKNPEFAFIEVFDDNSFNRNGCVLKSIVKLLQPFQFRYSQKEQFLGNFFEDLLNTSIKQESGQFFTPVPLCRFIITSLPIKDIVLRKINSKDEVLPFAIDYACGTGHFLTEYMDYVQKIIEGIDVGSIRSPSNARKIKIWKEIDKFAWSKDYVYGIDADYRLTKSAKVSSFLNGDGEANIIRSNGLGHFLKTDEYIGKLKHCSSSNPQDNNNFDILITNPPYTISAFKNTVEYGNESFILFDELTDKSSEIECLFVERAKQLLKEGGVAGIILPTALLNSGGVYAKTRDIIIKHFKIRSIIELGSNAFMATGTKTMAVFLEKRNDSDYSLVRKTVMKFLSDFKDVSLMGIENAFDSYVRHVYKDLSLQQYVEGIKTGSFIINEEISKMIAYLMCMNQPLLYGIIDCKNDKKILGYQFSEARSKSVFKILPSNQLYNEDNEDDPEKINSYIRRIYSGGPIGAIHESLSKIIHATNLVDMIKFDDELFDSTICYYEDNELQQYKSKTIPLGGPDGLCDLFIGGTPKTDKVKEYWTDGSHLWLTISEMNGNIIKDTEKKITDSAVNESSVKLVAEGTVLLSFKLSIGKVAIAGVPLYTNEAIAALPIRDENVILRDFLFMILKYRCVQLRTTGNKKLGQMLNSKTLSKVPIPVPSIEIQKSLLNKIKEIQDRKRSYEDLNLIESEIRAEILKVL